MRKLLLLSTSSFVLRTLVRLGMPGLFLMSALDSSFLVLPFGNDLLLIALVSSNRQSLIWMAYVLVSAVGSVLGVFVVDLLMRKAGEKGLERFVKPKRLERLKKKLENKLGATVFVATLLPPPFPSNSDGAHGFEPLHHVAVVDNFVPDIDRRAPLADRLLNDLDGPVHAGAEAPRGREQD